MMLVVKCPPKQAPANIQCTCNISLGKDNVSLLMTFSYLVSLWSHVVIIMFQKKLLTT